MKRVDVRQRCTVQIDACGASDVALLPRAVKKGRKVEVLHRHLARDRLPGCHQVRDQGAAHLTGRRLHVHLDLERVERAICLHVERRLQLDPGEGRHQPRDLGQREFVRRDLQVVNRRRQILLHGAVHRQRAFRRPQRQLLYKHCVVFHGDAARQRVHRECGLGAAERHLRNLDRVAHRLVLERQLRIQMIEALRYFNTRSTHW